MIAVLYVTLCAGAYYLVSRAKITEPLWSRYPTWLEYWTMCAACSGFWYGLGCAALGAKLDLHLFGLEPSAWYTWLIAAVTGMVWTPILSFMMTYSWTALLPDDDDGA